MTLSIHHCPDFRLRFHPSAHDALDMVVPGREISLVLAEDADLGLADGKFIAEVRAKSAGVSPVFFHDAAGVQQALDEVGFGHGRTIAWAGEGGDK